MDRNDYNIMCSFFVNKVMIMMLIFLFSCNTGKVVLENGPEQFDARFISQVFTWPCEDYEEDTAGESVNIGTTVGTYGHELAFFYEPNSLEDLLPASGCVYGAEMFPSSAGANGSSLEGLQGFPQWSNTVNGGELQGAFGYWFVDAMTDEHTCDAPGSILQFPATLGNANQFSNVSTETATYVPMVTFTGFQDVIGFGDTVTADWGSNGEWDRVWVEMQRTKDGDVYESVVCNVSGQTSFTLDDDFWGLLDPNLPIEYQHLYVGMEKRKMEMTLTDEWIELVTRVVTVAVIQD